VWAIDYHYQRQLRPQRKVEAVVCTSREIIQEKQLDIPIVEYSTLTLPHPNLSLTITITMTLTVNLPLLKGEGLAFSAGREGENRKDS